MATVAKSSFIRLVLPFSFERETYERLVKRTGEMPLAASGAGEETTKRWVEVSRRDGVHGAHRWAEPAALTFLEGDVESGGDRRPGLRSWTLHRQYQESREGLGTQNTQWGYRIPRKDQEISFKVSGVTLTVMRYGAGLIGLDVVVRSHELDDWLDLMTRARIPDRSGQGFVVKRKVSKDEVKSVWPGVMSGDPASEEPRPLTSLLEALLSQIEEGGRWWRSVTAPGLLLPYYGVVVDALPSETQGLVRYQLSRLATNRGGLDPSDAQLADDAPCAAHLSRQSWYLASPAGAGYLVFDPTGDYLRSGIPAHLKSELWCIFALAMQQRIVLQRLSTQVTAGWGEQDRLGSFDAARSELMGFVAEAYFQQVAVTNQLYADVYRLLVDRFEVRASYETVRSELSMIHDHLQFEHAQTQDKHALAQQRHTKEMERKLQVYGLPIAVASVLLGGLGVNMSGITSGNDGLPWWVVVVSVLGIILVTGGGVARAFPKGDEWEESEEESDRLVQPESTIE